MNDFDEEYYIEKYCAKNDCRQCDGTDYNGEQNGYGYEKSDEYVEKRYQSIIKRRMKRGVLNEK